MDISFERDGSASRGADAECDVVNPKERELALVCLCAWDRDQVRPSRRNLHAKLSISEGQLSKSEKGRSEIGAETLLRFARRSGIVEWLLTGKDGV